MTYPLPLFLIHGWAMHGGIFTPLRASLPDTLTTRTLDLPGHGQHRPMIAPGTTPEPIPGSLQAGDDNSAAPGTRLSDAWIEDLLARMPARCDLLGWSLGGRLAIRLAAEHPERVRRLILIAANPQFVASEDWPRAMARAAFDEFSASVKDDFEQTLARFLSLQVRGADDARASLRELRASMDMAPPPSRSGLEQGLKLLDSMNARSEFAALSQPTLALYGERDKLVPGEVATFLRALNPAVEVEIIEKAGHAPFLSHREQVAARIAAFLS